MNKRISVASPPGAHPPQTSTAAAAPEDDFLIKYTTFGTNKIPRKKLTTNWLSPVFAFHRVAVL
jgi:hypothetical protein